MLEGKTVVVGVTGGIAAYKAVEVVSRLRKLGAEVFVIMTKSATKLVAPITFRTLSNNPVVTDLFEEPKTWNVEHIALAERADLFLIVPATANVIGKVANGIADDFLTTTIMATVAPVLFAPAMNFHMYENPIFQRNKRTLEELGYYFLEPEYGRLASGAVGKGRLPEPEKIVAAALRLLVPEENGFWRGRRVLVTAGPTREYFDPVRFISNPSTGKMGYALAAAARRRGAAVRLISGPTNLPAPPGVELFPVVTAQEMLERVMENLEWSEVVIKAAAVADYRPAQFSPEKIKKTGGPLTVELERTPDILLEVGRQKGNRLLVGFAAETGEPREKARLKLEQKNLDLIVANDVTKPGSGFGTATNQVTLLFRDGRVVELPLLSKEEVAERILDEVEGLWRAREKEG